MENDGRIIFGSTVTVKDIESEKISELWKPGDRVRHPNFGSGVVVEVRERRDDIEVAVAFESKGVRRLLQSYAPLEADPN